MTELYVWPDVPKDRGPERVARTPERLTWPKDERLDPEVARG